MTGVGTGVLVGIEIIGAMTTVGGGGALELGTLGAFGIALERVRVVFAGLTFAGSAGSGVATLSAAVADGEAPSSRMNWPTVCDQCAGLWLARRLSVSKRSPPMTTG
jgi:hypothetical protein